LQSRRCQVAGAENAEPGEFEQLKLQVYDACTQTIVIERRVTQGLIDGDFVNFYDPEDLPFQLRLGTQQKASLAVNQQPI